MMPGRSYRIDGTDYPSVTHVLGVLAKPALARWRGKIGNEEADKISREATELGTRVHRACEQINLGAPDYDDAGLEAFTMTYERWFRERVRYVVGAEKLVVSRRYQFAGTCDLVAIMDDDDAPTLIDLKTSNSAGDDWPLQLAGYRLALREMGVLCGRRLVVQIPSRKPGTLETHEYADHDRDERAFRNALQLWRWSEAQRPQRPAALRFTFNGRA